MRDPVHPSIMLKHGTIKQCFYGIVHSSSEMIKA